MTSVSSEGSLQRDAARWYNAWWIRSLGSFGALLIELGHANLYATGLLVTGMADEPTPGNPNTSLPRI